MRKSGTATKSCLARTKCGRDERRKNHHLAARDHRDAALSLFTSCWSDLWRAAVFRVARVADCRLSLRCSVSPTDPIDRTPRELGPHRVAPRPSLSIQPGFSRARAGSSRPASSCRSDRRIGWIAVGALLARTCRRFSLRCKHAQPVVNPARGRRSQAVGRAQTRYILGMARSVCYESRTPL